MLLPLQLYNGGRRSLASSNAHPRPMVGTSRCDVPARVRAGGTNRARRAALRVAPLCAARTARRAVPTYRTTVAHPRPIGWGEGRGEGQFLVTSRGCKAVTETLHYLPPGRCRLRQIVKITGY